MNTIQSIRSLKGAPVYCAFAVFVMLGSFPSHAEDTAVAAGEQKRFDTPDAAFKELLNCCKHDNDVGMLGVLGQEHKDLVVQEDKEGMTETRQRICSAAAEHLTIVTEGNKATAYLGLKAWPYPIPIVKQGDSWVFDTAAGKEEILNRRIGRNELSALKFIDAYTDAQGIYGSADFTGDKVLKYAQKFMSADGKKDGLFWVVAPGVDGELSPMEECLDDCNEIEKKNESVVQYNGYCFKILTKQGASPPNGKYDYVINGNMIAGYALVAWPADYNGSGIMTFAVSHSGVVYEKDLGTDTVKIASSMEEYNTDKTWNEVKPAEDLEEIAGEK